MAFLGYERPIEYTGQQIFDPTMAKMVLDALDKYFNAVYADYQQGLENMKEFKKEYGDFITPILADQEWYNNNVTGRVRNFINDAYSKGIDLTRSAEGRAAIAQMINSIDVGKISKLRSSAENAKEYLREQAKLEAAGLYNPLLEKYAGKGMDTFSTLGGDGIWDRMSPTRITDMATFGNPFFEGMKPNVHSESKNGISYTVESITPEDLERIANDHYNELVNTPQGQLMYKYYRDLAGGDSNPNADILARSMFNSAVAAGLSRRIYQKDNYNDNYIENQKLNLQREQLVWNKYKDQIELQLKAQQLGNGARYNPETGQYEIDNSSPMTWIDKMTTTHQLNTADKLVGNGGELIQNLSQIADYYKNKANEILQKTGGKVVSEQQIEYEKPEETKKSFWEMLLEGAGASTRYGSSTSGTSVNPYTVENRKHVRTIKTVDPSKNKEYQAAKAEASKWEGVLNSFATAFSPVPDRTKYKDEAQYKNALNKWTSARNVVGQYVDLQTGIPTGNFMREMYRINDPAKSGVVSTAKLGQLSNQWYDMFTTKTPAPVGSLTNNNLIRMMSTSANREDIPGLSDKHYKVNFDRIMYSPVHRANISGGARYRHGSIEAQFDRYLRSSADSGFILNEQMNSAGVPVKGRNRTRIESFGDVMMSQVQFDKFYNQITWGKQGYEGHLSKQEVLQRLGLRPVYISSKQRANGSIGKDFEEIAYYAIPATAAHDPGNTMATNEYNDMYTSGNFGSSNAYKEEVNSENSSFQSR